MSLHTAMDPSALTLPVPVTGLLASFVPCGLWWLGEAGDAGSGRCLNASGAQDGRAGLSKDAGAVSPGRPATPPPYQMLAAW